MKNFITKTMSIALAIMLCVGSLFAQETRVEKFGLISSLQSSAIQQSMERAKSTCSMPAKSMVESKITSISEVRRGPIKATLTDDVESYTAFAVNPTGGPIGWTFLDVSGGSTYGIDGYTFDNAYGEHAFMVFKPSATTPALATGSGWDAHGGSQYFVTFAEELNDNNDWMISPELSEPTGFSFWARSYTSLYGLERFKVGYSTTGNAPADFTIITSGSYVQAPTAWTEYTYDIPSNAKYVAINCVSSDAFAFMVDDITITAGEGPQPNECDPVTNLSVNYSSDCSEAVITWTAPGKGSKAETLLWDQMNVNQGNSGWPCGAWNSGAQTCYIFDDFVLSSDATITKFTAQTGITTGQVERYTVGVQIRAHDAVNNRPGEVLHTFTGLTGVGGTYNIGSITITPTTPFDLTAGKYWISIYGEATVPYAETNVYLWMSSADATLIETAAHIYGNHTQTVIGAPNDAWYSLNAQATGRSVVFGVYGEAQSTPDEKQYKVYRDGVLLTTTTETSYTDNSFNATAGHTWAVVAVCEDGDSDEVTATKPACEEPGGDCPGVTNFSAAYNGDCEAVLTWEEPSGKGEKATEIFYESCDNYLLTWTMVDADGDGSNWFGLTTADNPALVPYQGIGFVRSLSWTSSIGGLYPNNWMISPAITVNGSLSLEYYVVAGDPDYPGDKHAVYMSTTGTNISDFVEVKPAMACPTTWTKQTVDLGTQNGTIYIAFRHYDSYDHFAVHLDEIKVFQEGGTTPSDYEYNVYRDDVKVAGPITETTYTDSGFGLGDGHTWSVAAICESGLDSDWSSQTLGPCNSGDCDGVTNFSAAYNGDCEAVLTWSAPAKSFGAGYNAALRATVRKTKVENFPAFTNAPANDIVGLTSEGLSTWTAPIYSNDRATALPWEAPSKTRGKGILFDQAEYVTHPGQGAGGADASEIYSGGTAYGPNATYPSFCIADDFVLASDSHIDEIEFYGYQTGSGTTSTFTGVYVNIYDGSPASGGQVIWNGGGTNLISATSFTNCYRVNTNTYTNTDRPIMRIVAEIDLDLSAGTYWVSASFAGSGTSGPWGAPMASTSTGNTGNGLQQGSAGWGNWLDSGDGTQKGLPMIIYGDVITGGDVAYNVYRDGAKIAGPITTTTYTDSGFGLGDGHTWSVAAICESGLDSDWSSQTLGPCNQGDCPGVTNLAAAYNGDCAAVLSWEEPAKSSKAAIFEDVESHTAFTVNSPGSIGWSYIDGDGGETYVGSSWTFPNGGDPMAFIVFDPTTPGLDFPAHSGAQYFACFNSAEGVTNDWIISPELTNPISISFWARSLTTQYGAERFRVCVSSTGTAQGDFTAISSGSYVTVQETWTEFSYNIPAGSKYVAINCVSDDAFAFFVDDITIEYEGGTTPSDYEYNVYRDGAKIAGPITTTTYTDSEVDFTTAHQWSVAAICESGLDSEWSSISLEPCEPQACQPVENLTAEYGDRCEAILAWEEPGGKKAILHPQTKPEISTNRPKKEAIDYTLPEPFVGTYSGESPKQIDSKGNMVFGYRSGWAEPEGHITFDVDNPGTSTTHSSFTAGILGGEYFDGYYYASENATGFNLHKVDHATGSATVLASQSTYYNDLTYNYDAGVMYAFKNPGDIYTIDLNTGVATLLKTISDTPTNGFITVACDLAGNMYGIELTDASTISNLYSIDVAAGTCSLIGPTGFIARYAQGMSFDHSTGTLYWCQYGGSGASNFCSVNTTTGVATSIASGVGEIGGVYFPYIANQNVAAAPTNVVVAPKGVSLNGTVSWTNPSTTLAGDPLASITKMVLLMDGAVYQEYENPTVGGAMNQSVTVPSAGTHAFAVYAVTSEGNGQQASGSALFGDLCYFYIDMFDDYGDGWNGSYMTIAVDGVNQGSVTLSGGSSGRASVLAPTGNTVFTWFVGSNYDDEIFFDIYNSAEELIYQQPFDEIGPSAGVFFTYDNVCSSGQYNIYRDGVLIAEQVTETTYIDTEVDPSEIHEWAVATVCGDDESEWRTVTIDELCAACNPPINVVAEKYGTNPPAPFQNNIMVTWEAPEEDEELTFVGYNVYRNDIQVAEEIEDLFYDDADLSKGEYLYCITAVYDNDCESREEVCTETIVIVEGCTDMPGPVNVSSVQHVDDWYDVDILWEAPAGEILGYNIYRDGVLLSQEFLPATPTSYRDRVPGQGMYVYEVTAIYAETFCESERAATTVIMEQYPCEVLWEVPLFESFDDFSAFPPMCWELGPGSTPWKQVATGTSPSVTPYSGGGMLQYNAYSYSAGAKGLLISPKFVTTEDDYTVKFMMYRDNSGTYGSSTYAERVNVYLSATNDIDGLTPLYTVHRNISLAPAVTEEGWHEFSVQIPTSEISGGAYVIFEGVGEWGNNVYVDDIAIINGGDCYPVENVVVEQPQEGDVLISWTAAMGDELTGYRIFRDGIMIANNYQETSILDHVSLGAHEYCIVALFNKAKCTESIPVCLMVDVVAQCDPVLSVTAEIIADDMVQLSWIPSSASGVSSYSVYRDGALVGTTHEVYYMDGNVPAGSHIYGVVVNYNSKPCQMSDAVLSNAIQIEYCVPVTNLEAVTTTESVTLTWDFEGEGFVETAMFEDFESGIPSTWKSVDADGDAFLWEALSGDGNTGGNCVYSESFWFIIALNPDNWLITPQMTLTGVETLEYYIKTQDPAYPDEHYGVYISTTGSNPSDFTVLFEETLTAAESSWTRRTVDLSAYSGPVYIAFRHFNSYDLFQIRLDDVKIEGTWGVPTFDIYRDGMLLANVSDRSFVDTNVEIGATYEYCVKAVYDNCTVESTCVTAEMPTCILGDVTNLSATQDQVEKPQRVDLTWMYSGQPTEFEIQRSEGLAFETRAIVSEMAWSDEEVEYNKMYTYFVRAIREGCESGEGDYTNIILRPVGINDDADVAVNIYPNPASTSVTIEGADIVEIEIYNSIGQLIDRIAAVEGETVTSVNVAAYKTGAYIFRLISADKTMVNKPIMIAR